MKTIAVQNIAIGYIALWAVSPPLFMNDMARLLVLLATALWVTLELFRRDRPDRWINLPVTLTLLFLAYTGFMETFLYGSEQALSSIQIWIMLFFLIVGQSRRNDLQSLVPVFWFILVVYPVWMFITVNTIATVNSHAARTIVRNSTEAGELSQQGVGGYALVYGTLLLIPGLIGLLRNPRVLWSKALPRPLRRMPWLAFGLVAINLGLGVVLVLTAGFAIAVIALVGILLSVIFLERFNAPRVLIVVLVTVFFALFGRSILEVTLTALLPLAEGTHYANKASDGLASLQVGDAVGTAEGRAERYTRSLHLFGESPLIGVLTVDNLGKHSQILDCFAQWGAVIGGVFVYLVSFPAIRVKRGSKRYFGVGLAMLAAVAVIFGLNNGFAAAGLMLYIMFPVSVHLLGVQGARRSRDKQNRQFRPRASSGGSRGSRRRIGRRRSAPA